MNITEIATAVGFNTTSYFIKLFKGYKNISPKQFRKEFVIAEG
jgi:AraC-like DNA-binding protein